MLLYHKNILRFGCMHSVLWHGSETEFAVEFFRAECNKITASLRKMREKIFQDWLPKNWYIRCGNCHGGTPLCFSEVSLHSQINIIVYWDVWMWKKKRCNPLCCCRIVWSMCAFWNLFEINQKLDELLEGFCYIKWIKQCLSSSENG